MSVPGALPGMSSLAVMLVLIASSRPALARQPDDTPWARLFQGGLLRVLLEQLLKGQRWRALISGVREEES